MDNLDFLDGGEEPTAQTVTPETAEAELPEGPARGPDGKFVAKAEPDAEQPAPEMASAEPAPAEPPAPEPAKIEPAKPPEGYVPVAALQELRNELKALKAQAPTTPPPDPYEDLEGYREHVAQAQHAERLNWSYRLAEIQHGKETAEQVKAWAVERADLDPVFNQQAQTHPDPFAFAVEQYQREQALSLLADPKALEAFKAFVAGQTAPAPQIAAQAAPPQQPSPTPPTRSLAAAPAAGGDKPGAVPVYEGAAFDDTFK